MSKLLVSIAFFLFAYGLILFLATRFLKYYYSKISNRKIHKNKRYCLDCKEWVPDYWYIESEMSCISCKHKHSDHGH